MAKLLKIRSIDAFSHKLDEFVTVFIYFLGKNNKKKIVYVCINCKLHVVNGLKANMLISNDIINLKQILVDISKKTTFIVSYRVQLTVKIK